MSDQTTQVKLWGGRFTGKTDPLYMFYDSGRFGADFEFAGCIHSTNP